MKNSKSKNKYSKKLNLKKYKILLILISIFLVVLAGYFIYDKVLYKDKSVFLQITEQEWTGWSSQQPNPSIEVKEVKKGDKIDLFWDDEKYAHIIIKRIRNNEVIVSFNNKQGIAKASDDGIDLISKKKKWRDNINYDVEYEISTQTMDAGMSWIFLFSEK